MTSPLHTLEVLPGGDVGFQKNERLNQKKMLDSTSIKILCTDRVVPRPVVQGLSNYTLLV